MDIEKAPEQNGFYLAERTFELAELKLLVDAVAASKVHHREKVARTGAKRSNIWESAYQGRHLHRQVVVSDRCQNGKRAYLLHDRRDLSVY